MARSLIALNSAKNGKRLVRLNLGELPPELADVDAEARVYRHSVEGALVESGRGINIADAHHVDYVTQTAIHAGLCLWLLRNRFNQMSDADKILCSKEILLAKEKRARTIRRMGLDEREQQPVDLLYGNGPDADEGGFSWPYGGGDGEGEYLDTDQQNPDTDELEEAEGVNDLDASQEGPPDTDEVECDFCFDEGMARPGGCLRCGLEDTQPEDTND